MSTVTIPKNAGTFRIEWGGRGNLRVMNDKTGKNQVIIAVDSQSQAEELCRRLNAGEHNGQVSVPSRIKR